MGFKEFFYEDTPLTYANDHRMRKVERMAPPKDQWFKSNKEKKPSPLPVFNPDMDQFEVEPKLPDLNKARRSREQSVKDAKRRGGDINDETPQEPASRAVPTSKTMVPTGLPA